MKSILLISFALFACLVVFANCDHIIKTKVASKDSLVLESTNNEDTIEFMFKNSEHFPLIGVKLVRQGPTSTNSSQQASSGSQSQSQQSGSQSSSSQTVQPATSSQMQQEQANTTASSSQQQQQSNASAQAASQSQQSSSNQTQTVEKQDNPQAQSSAQAGSQGASSSSQSTTPQASNQNSTTSSSSTSQSSQQGSSSTSQSTSQTNPISQDNSSISGDHQMDLNATQPGGGATSDNSTAPNSNTTLLNQTTSQMDNSTAPNSNTTLFINQTLQNIGITNSTEKQINLTDIIGRIISGENITEIINNTLGNLTQWLNSTLGNDTSTTNQTSQSKRASIHRRLLSILESKEENEEDYAQYLKFNKLKLMSSAGETVKEIPLSDANIHWNYGHSVVVNNNQPFKVPHVDVEIPLSTSNKRPTLKIRTMMTEAPSHFERNGKDVQLSPKSMDIQISLNNLHDLLTEQEKKLSGAKWTIETELTSTTNALHFMQTKNLNGVQRVVVMGNNFTPKGQFSFNASANMKVIQDDENDALISIQVHDSSNSIQLNTIKFGLQ